MVKIFFFNAKELKKLKKVANLMHSQPTTHQPQLKTNTRSAPGLTQIGLAWYPHGHMLCHCHYSMCHYSVRHYAKCHSVNHNNGSLYNRLFICIGTVCSPAFQCTNDISSIPVFTGTGTDPSNHRVLHFTL